ncbi:hypothetical protein BGW80DRAFT_1179039 [Lactifluus volemus]|nr:hypothetical protein BGW80DRAFT_1179039 [Lactifluus volemus]
MPPAHIIITRSGIVPGHSPTQHYKLSLLPWQPTQLTLHNHVHDSRSYRVKPSLVDYPCTIDRLTCSSFSWVAASLLSVSGLLYWQAINVARARRRPRYLTPVVTYADKAEQEASTTALVFNCKQRAHQNTLEYIPVLLTVTLVSSLHYPIPAAVGCGLWTVARVFYTLGYGTGTPSKVRNL